MTVSWRPFFFTSSICIILVSICLLMVHFGQMIPWFIYGLYNFAIYDLLLIFADIFFITLGTTSLIISLNDNDENITYKYKRLLLILIVAFTFIGFTIAYPFILLLQWTSHFAISQRLIIYFGPAFSFISPSISVVFWFIVLCIGSFASVSSFGFVKQTEKELWLFLKGDKINRSNQSSSNATNGEETIVMNNKQEQEQQTQLTTGLSNVGNEVGNDVVVDLPLQQQQQQVEEGIVYQEQDRQQPIKSASDV